MTQFVSVIDLDRCIGCRGGCQVACKHEHTIALGASRCSFYNVGPTGVFPDLELYSLPVMCQQCSDPICAAVCPTGACTKSAEDGVVYIDRAICSGCKTCLESCPFGSIIFNNELNDSDKCDLCSSRRKNGEVPACARNCAGAAIYCGDISDTNSEISKLLAQAGEDNVFSLTDTEDKNALEAKPSGRFILRGAKWQDPMPIINAVNPNSPGYKGVVKK